MKYTFKRYRFTQLCLPSLILCFFLNACQHHPAPAQNNAEQQKNEKVQISPMFNADSAYAYTDKQVAFGPRIPGTPAHEKCGQYLIDFFKKNGASVFIQSGKVTVYTGKTYELENIIASCNPTAKTRVMLSAHWDARPFSDQDPNPLNHNKPFDAANDGGSGVAILMEITRDLQQKNPGIGVDMVLWDVEDYGSKNDTSERSWCLGTQYWAKHPPVVGYAPLYCINLDMVGGENAVFNMDKASMEFAPDVVQKVWDIGNDIGFSQYFSYTKVQGEVTDDHVYVDRDAKIPAIDIVDFNDQTGFYKYWHTQDDKMRHIDKNVLKAVGQTILETVYREGKSGA